MNSKIASLLRDLVNESIRVFLGLLKIMLPISIVVRLLQQTNIIEYLGQVFGPLVIFLGLPPDGALVWVNTLITNIYGGMITFHALGMGNTLSVAQTSVLCQLMLVAHTFPIELTVARKVGIPLLSMFLWRFGFAIVSAWFLYKSLSLFDLLNSPVRLLKTMSIPGSTTDTWSEWLLHELHRYTLVFIVVFALMFLMRILKATGFLDAFTRWLKPVMNWLGIHSSVIPITVVGMTLGILYGGALMIEETRKNNIAPKDIFYAFCLMGLCHSIIEDSLLMMSLGANGLIVFLYRPAWALLTLFITLRLFEKLPANILARIVSRNR